MYLIAFSQGMVLGAILGIGIYHFIIAFRLCSKKKRVGGK